jgi:hypothetical protein
MTCDPAFNRRFIVYGAVEEISAMRPELLQQLRQRWRTGMTLRHRDVLGSVYVYHPTHAIAGIEDTLDSCEGLETLASP